MKAEIEDSSVEPANSESVKTAISIAGSASDREHHFAARSDAAEAGADIESRERQHEARGAEQRDDDDEISGGPEGETGGEGRHQRRRHPGGRKDDVGRRPKEPGGVLGDDHLLADQFQQVAVGLKERWSASSQEPRPDPARHAGEQRCGGEHQHDLHELREPAEPHRKPPTITSSSTSAANTSVR